ncbi:MAG: hypothetical protein ACRDNS_12815, partial [Trebonia sp.]
GGEGLAAEAIKAAAKDGIAKRTLQRARTRAGITKMKDGFGGPWIWRLPAEAAAQGAVGAAVNKLAPMAPSSAPSTASVAATMSNDSDVHSKRASATGPCATCGKLTNRYGENGRPLCDECTVRRATFDPEQPDSAVDRVDVVDPNAHDHEQDDDAVVPLGDEPRPEYAYLNVAPGQVDPVVDDRRAGNEPPVTVVAGKRLCADCGKDRLHSQEAHDRGVCVSCWAKRTTLESA